MSCWNIEDITIDPTESAHRPYLSIWMPLGKKKPETQALLIAGHLLMDLGFDCVLTPVLGNQWSFHTKKMNQ